MRDMGVVVRLPEFVPLAYMRGRTFHRTICILDEAQNCTVKQLHVFLTRMGIGSRMIITGDLRQSDIKRSGLETVTRLLEPIGGIVIHRFGRCDIVRHKLVQQVDEALEGFL
jgi:phosphate starvation-inducible protein PhoH and related proteins